MLLLILIGTKVTYAQQVINNSSKVIFQASELQEFGFDDYRYPEWIRTYDTISLNFIGPYIVSNKSVGKDASDFIDAIFLNKKFIDQDSLRFEIVGTSQRVRYIQKNDSTFTLVLPEKKADYKINAIYKGLIKGQLKVYVFEPKFEKIIIVPLMNNKINQDSLEKSLLKIYRQANIQFDVNVKPIFRVPEFDKDFLVDNPSPKNETYTLQMQEIRDAYFDQFPKADDNAYYFFIIPGFVNPSIRGFMVKSKSMGFIKNGNDSFIAKVIARQLGYGMGILSDSWENNGPSKGSTYNLMDINGGTNLTAKQWLSLRHSTNTFSYYDNYEHVSTNNGMVAYYFWEENADGTIKMVGNDFLKSVKRPFKKNYFSYHLEIDNPLFLTLFSIDKLKFNVCSLHLVAVLSVLILAYLIRRKFHRYLRFKFRRTRILRILSRIVFIGGSIITLIWFFYLVDLGYTWFEVNEGEVKVLKNYSMLKAQNEIKHGLNVKHEFESSLSSELLVKTNNKWEKKKRKRVLYFSIKKDELGKSEEWRFTGSSDSLILEKHGLYVKAESHYFVLSYLDENNKLSDQRLLNHKGYDLNSIIKLKDPAQRILVFVNGYRPSSLGHSFKDYFTDISKNGLEHENSENIIYDNDRFGYWHPWQEIDVLFQKRINPSMTYFADGHFSVSTSNHGSLVNFTTLASVYPQRCANSQKHTCYTTTIAGSGLLGSKTIVSNELLRDLESNVDGFNLRKANGIIAGKNMLQILNELPNKSGNDTLFIVAHSMGYAYSLGMIEALRNRINFGGFYIIAPENAGAGNINMDDWQEIWQYGSNLNKGTSEPACLQDGIAPQKRVAGLTPSHRVFIPTKNYKEKGFFDSHFVGYYKWILEIKKGQPGYIKQR
jgi:hypothetical protein